MNWYRSQMYLDYHDRRSEDNRRGSFGRDTFTETGAKYSEAFYNDETFGKDDEWKEKKGKREEAQEEADGKSNRWHRHIRDKQDTQWKARMKRFHSRRTTRNNRNRNTIAAADSRLAAPLLMCKKDKKMMKSLERFQSRKRKRWNVGDHCCSKDHEKPKHLIIAAFIIAVIAGTMCLVSVMVCKHNVSLHWPVEIACVVFAVIGFTVQYIRGSCHVLIVICGVISLTTAAVVIFWVIIDIMECNEQTNKQRTTTIAPHLEI